MILFVFEGEMQRNLNQSERQGCCFSEGNIQALLKKYVLPEESVSVLSAFPLFLYEYFPN